MKSSEDEWESMPIIIKDEAMQVVSDFKYLGSIIECQGEVNRDIEERIGRASRAFGILQNVQYLWTETCLLKQRD